MSTDFLKRPGSRASLLLSQQTGNDQRFEESSSSAVKKCHNHNHHLLRQRHHHCPCQRHDNPTILHDDDPNRGIGGVEVEVGGGAHAAGSLQCRVLPILYLRQIGSAPLFERNWSATVCVVKPSSHETPGPSATP